MVKPLNTKSPLPNGGLGGPIPWQYEGRDIKPLNTTPSLRHGGLGVQCRANINMGVEGMILQLRCTNQGLGAQCRANINMEVGGMILRLRCQIKGWGPNAVPISI